MYVARVAPQSPQYSRRLALFRVPAWIGAPSVKLAAKEEPDQAGEATTITGPAKNLLQFAQCARDSGADTAITVFQRGAGPNLLMETAQRAATPVYAVRESGALRPDRDGGTAPGCERMEAGR